MEQIMNDEDYKRECRRQTRLERLGSNNPTCLFCPENAPCCLELHHLSGITFGDERVVVCRNCHRKLSEKQKEHPPALTTDPNTLERLGRLLLGIGDALELLQIPEQLVGLLRRGGLHLIDYGQLFAPREGDLS
jgi:hypothetical protein